MSNLYDNKTAEEIEALENRVFKKNQKGLKEALDQAPTPESIAGITERTKALSKIAGFSIEDFRKINVGAIISDPGDEVESISSAASFVMQRPKYSKNILKQMNEAAGAIRKAFESTGPIKINSKFRTTKENETLQDLMKKKHISEKEFDQIIKIKTNQFLHFN